jgi:hypothetical protein
MVKKEGKIPCNCRVDVDYSGVKPKIKFGYTSKNPKLDSYKQNFYGRPLLLIILFLGCFILIISSTFTKVVPFPEECNVTLNESHYTYYFFNYEEDTTSNYTYNYVTGAKFICNNGNYSVYFKTIYEFIESKDVGFYYKDKNVWDSLILFFIYISFIILIFILVIFINKYLTIYLIKKKWYCKWLPEHMAGSLNKRKKYYKFVSKDVDENMIVIPYFKNVELIYKTEGDFSKYLRRIKIREFRYNIYKKQKVGRLKVSPYNWTCIFYFKQKPKNGYLEVIWQ